MSRPRRGSAAWLEDGHGVLVGQTDPELSRHILRLSNHDDFAADQSEKARSQVEGRYDVPNTYGKLIHDLKQWSFPKGLLKTPEASGERQPPSSNYFPKASGGASAPCPPSLSQMIFEEKTGS